MDATLQSPTIPASRFICLEDRLLVALYEHEGPVSLQSLAALLFITPNAALSIAHRIQKAYPSYLQLNEVGDMEDHRLIPENTQVHAVHQFLKEGGFTSINEQEFIMYYEKELNREKRQAILQHYKARIIREKWVIGISSLVCLGIIMATYLHRKNKVF